MLPIKTMIREVRRKRVQERFVRRRIRIAEIIDRLDNAAAEEMAPDPIDRHASEEGVLRLREPFREGLPAILIRRDFRLSLEGKPRRHLTTGAGLRDLPTPRGKDNKLIRD